jgi:type II secretory pathway pseudopilin PulG
MRKRAGIWIVVGLGLLLVLPVLVGRLLPVKDTTRTVPFAETVQNAKAIQLALQRYYGNNGQYPQTVDALVAEGYLTALPPNAYRRREPDRSMRSVELDAVDGLGDFTYLPRVESGEVVGFDLFAYATLHSETVRRDDPAWRHIGIYLGPLEDDAQHGAGKGER